MHFFRPRSSSAQAGAFLDYGCSWTAAILTMEIRDGPAAQIACGPNLKEHGRVPLRIRWHGSACYGRVSPSLVTEDMASVVTFTSTSVP